MSVNKVILIGNLGGKPELRRIDGGKSFCNFSIATNHHYKTNDSGQQSYTEWHQVVCFGVIAENCTRFLAKGRQVYIEGRIQSQRWTDRNENERISHRIVANVVQFLGTKPLDSSASSTADENNGYTENSEVESADLNSNDIPW